MEYLDHDDEDSTMVLCLKKASAVKPRQKIQFSDVKDAYEEKEWELYCETMKENILAEFCSEISECHYVYDVHGQRAPPDLVKRSKFSSREPVLLLTNENKMRDLADIKDHIIRSQRTKMFYWITRVEPDPLAPRSSLMPTDDDKDPIKGSFSVLVQGIGLGMVNGTAMGTVNLDIEGLFSVVCFAGDYLHRIRSANSIKLSPDTVPWWLRMQVLDASWRQWGTYWKYSPIASALHTGTVSMNTKQKEAVEGLSERVEIVQGPPGTGKSTTIVSMITRHIGGKSKALVTAVTNQAIDVVSEKLKNAKIRHLVLCRRDSRRIGKTAANFTLESLIENDEFCLFFQKRMDRLNKYAGYLQDFHRARISAICGGYGSGRNVGRYKPKPGAYRRHPRLMEEALKDAQAIYDEVVERGNFLLQTSFPGCSSSICTIIDELFTPDNKERAIVYGIMHLLCQNGSIDPIAKYIIELRVGQHIDKIRRKIANSYIIERGTPYKILLKLAYSIDSSKKWSMMQLLAARKTMELMQFVKIKLEGKLQRFLNWARLTAEDRAVRDASAILVTIGSSTHYLPALQSKYKDYFKENLKMAILDEAGSTAETYIPMLLSLGVQNIVMVGDHKQLSPLVKGVDKRDADLCKVTRSLMARMIDRSPRYRMLTTQYRMPQNLSKIVSDTFYDGKLEDGVHRESSGKEIQFFDVTEEECRIDTGYVYEAQAIAVCRLLKKFSNRDQVMIICLYKKQVTLLECALESTLKDRPHWRLITVDAAQGSEADHVILCSVRSNPRQNLGFTTERRRLNVAISRAKQTFSIVGCSVTLGADRTWASILQKFSPGKWPGVDDDTIMEEFRSEVQVIRKKVKEWVTAEKEGKGKGYEESGRTESGKGGSWGQKWKSRNFEEREKACCPCCFSSYSTNCCKKNIIVQGIALY